jgi:hypothetical protein
VPRRLALAGLAALAVAAVPVGSALAATSGSVSETITVAVRSVTVSPSSASLCSSASPLTFPNGRCQTSNITITNGSAAGHIDVNGADAIPADSGTHWTLCAGTVAPTCSGGGNAGQDQYRENTFNNSNTSIRPDLTNTPQCDTSFAPGSACAAAAGQSTKEFIAMTGPSASTDTSSTFTSSVTWTAVP